MPAEQPRARRHLLHRLRDREHRPSHLQRCRGPQCGRRADLGDLQLPQSTPIRLRPPKGRLPPPRSVLGTRDRTVAWAGLTSPIAEPALMIAACPPFTPSSAACGGSMGPMPLGRWPDCPSIPAEELRSVSDAESPVSLVLSPSDTAFRKSTTRRGSAAGSLDHLGFAWSDATDAQSCSGHGSQSRCCMRSPIMVFR